MGNQSGGRLFLNDGKGRFTVAAGVAGSPFDLEFMDIDSDGDPDLLVSEGSSAVGQAKGALYLNDGKGRFTADPTGRRVPPGIWLRKDFTSGDVDGDGDPDFLVNSRELNVQLALNDGKGFFANATPRRVPPLVRGWPMALGDVDGDGDLDLAINRWSMPRFTTTSWSKSSAAESSSRTTAAQAARPLRFPPPARRYASCARRRTSSTRSRSPARGLWEELPPPGVPRSSGGSHAPRVPGLLRALGVLYPTRYRRR